MTLEMLAHFALAACIGHAAHALLEVFGMRTKFRRVKLAVKGEVHPDPLHALVDAPWKSLLVGLIVVGLVGGLAFGVIWLWNPDVRNTLTAIVGVALGVEVINTLHIDRYHRDVQDVLVAMKAEADE